MATAITTSNTHTALRIHGREKLQLDQITPLPCGANDVRLKVAFCGICGSDIHEYQALPIFAPAPGCKHHATGVELPVVMGHEMSGTIIEVGTAVKDLTVGTNVAVCPALDDRSYNEPPCFACRIGKPNICKRFATYGLSAWGGGFSSEIVVKDFNCFPLPSSVSLEVGALTEPLAVAWHCIRESGFQKGQSALVLGAGPIGLAILLLLKVWDAGKVFVTEVTEARQVQAQKFGADVVINPLPKSHNTTPEQVPADPVVQAIRKLCEDGVDVAFDATGLQSTLDTALAATCPGGTIYNVAIHEKPLLFNPNDIGFLEKRYLGGICYLKEDFDAVINAMADGRIPFENMITSIVPLRNAIEGGFMELMRNKSKHVKILIKPEHD